MKVKENPHIGAIVYIGIVAALSTIIFVTDLAVRNHLGAVLSAVMALATYFSLGFVYCRFDKWNRENGVELFKREPKVVERAASSWRDGLIKEILAGEAVDKGDEVSVSEEKESGGEDWCSGSTRDFDSLCGSSNLPSSANNIV